MAREVAAEGITVNCICPTNLDSDMIHNEAFYALFAPGIDKPTREQVIPGFASLNAIPIPWIEAIDISNAMMFLALPGGSLHHRGSTARQRGLERLQRGVSAGRGHAGW